MQAWTPQPPAPQAEVRIQDNLQRKGLLAPPPARKDGLNSATVEILGRVDDDQRLDEFRGWLRQGLQVSFQNPPPTLDSVQLIIFMANPADPVKAIRDQVLFTRGWCEAPQQLEAQRGEAAKRAIGF